MSLNPQNQDLPLRRCVTTDYENFWNQILRGRAFASFGTLHHFYGSFSLTLYEKDPPFPFASESQSCLTFRLRKMRKLKKFSKRIPMRIKR